METTPTLSPSRCILYLGGALFATTLNLTARGEAPANGTTVFRCIDAQGQVHFADAPCRDSASTRLRIEHSLVQSAPISIADQQRLHALERRLQTRRKSAQRTANIEQRRRRAERNAAAERCRQAQQGLAQIRTRKKRGYPLAQARRIEREEHSLQGEIETHCSG